MARMRARLSLLQRERLKALEALITLHGEYKQCCKHDNLRAQIHWSKDSDADVDAFLSLDAACRKYGIKI